MLSKEEALMIWDKFFEWHKTTLYISIKRDDFEEFLNVTHNIIDPTPEAANSPFTRDELEEIIMMGEYLISTSAYKNELRKSIISKGNHLLTTIPPKVKTLDDLKEGDDVYVVKAFKGVDFGVKITFDAMNAAGDYLFKDSRSLICVLRSELKDLVSLTPPTLAQIATAKQAAIEEVERRFAELEKEVGNGNN